MKQQQFIRFVEQICYLLKLSQPCSKTALQYFLQFKQYQGHNYDQEIIIAACIYLSVKIFEEQARIRDILNMIYVLTKLYKMAHVAKNEETQQIINLEKSQNRQKQEIHDNAQHIIEPSKQNTHQHEQQQQQAYISLKILRHYEDLADSIQPAYSLSDYNEYKGKIIEAEQTLLRILGFSFNLASQNKKQLKRLLITIHHMKIPSTIAQTIVKVYNDIQYIQINYWLEGVIYFAFRVAKCMIQLKQNNHIQQQNVNLEQQVIQLKQESINLNLKQQKSTNSNNKKTKRQVQEIKKMKNWCQIMNNETKWENILCTQVKQLQKYAQKLTSFYEDIKTSP